MYSARIIQKSDVGNSMKGSIIGPKDTKKGTPKKTKIEKKVD